MIFFIVILIGIIFNGMTAAKKNEFIPDYCSPKNTAAINGIFSVLIFLSHATAYTYSARVSVWSDPYFDLRTFLGQLVVVTYLFFSGYGIMESYKKKGRDYIKSIPVHRFFKTWLHFAIALIPYSYVFLEMFQKEKTPQQIALAFVGFETFGNSNWYMFVTFALYIIVFVSCIWFKKASIVPAVLTTILTVGFVFVLNTYREPLSAMNATFASHWYNTVLCFPAGMLFSVVKPLVDKILMKHDVLWFTGLFGSFMLFYYFSQHRNDRILYHSLFAIFFCTTIVLLMMKVNIRNSILDWFGEHIFSFFILQKLPFMIFMYLKWNVNYVLFIIISFFATVFLCVIFDEAMAKLDSLLFKKRVKKSKAEKKEITA